MHTRGKFFFPFSNESFNLHAYTGVGRFRNHLSAMLFVAVDFLWQRTKMIFYAPKRIQNQNVMLPRFLRPDQMNEITFVFSSRIAKNNFTHIIVIIILIRFRIPIFSCNRHSNLGLKNRIIQNILIRFIIYWLMN